MLGHFEDLLPGLRVIVFQDVEYFQVLLLCLVVELCFDFVNLSLDYTIPDLPDRGKVLVVLFEHDQDHPPLRR